MSGKVENNSHSLLSFKWPTIELSARSKQLVLMAVSVLMALGFVLSYCLGAPWPVLLGFFALSLAPLFPLFRARNSDPSKNI